MKDFIENMEDVAESRYYEMIQSDGKLKCGCGRIFDFNKEGGMVSPNPYAMPVCGECFEDQMHNKSIRPIKKQG